jgi:hypothetical protein
MRAIYNDSFLEEIINAARRKQVVEDETDENGEVVLLHHSLARERGTSEV